MNTPTYTLEDIELDFRRLHLGHDCMSGLWHALESEGSRMAPVLSLIGINPWLEKRLLRVAEALTTGTLESGGLMARVLRSVPEGLMVRVVLAAYLQQLLTGPELGYGWSESDHWSHAIFVACVNEELARRAGAPPAAAFMAGLGHGIGRYFLGWHVTRWGLHLEHGGALSADQLREEATRFGMNQCDVGSAVLRRLGFGEVVHVPVRWFRYPKFAGAHTEACARLEEAFDLVLLIRSQVATGATHGADISVTHRAALAEAVRQVRLIELSMVAHQTAPPFQMVASAVHTQPPAGPEHVARTRAPI